MNFTTKDTKNHEGNFGMEKQKLKVKKQKTNSFFTDHFSLSSWSFVLFVVNKPR